MFCTNCGNKLLSNAKFCTKCGKQVINQNIENNNANVLENDYQFVNNQQMNVESNSAENKRANQLCIWSILCGLVFPRCMFLFEDLISGEIISSISGLCSLAGLVLMIIARIKYPNSKFAKVLMWIYIISFILFVVYMIFVIVMCVSCVNSCSNTNTSGCY